MAHKNCQAGSDPESIYPVACLSQWPVLAASQEVTRKAAAGLVSSFNDHMRFLLLPVPPCAGNRRPSVRTPRLQLFFTRRSLLTSNPRLLRASTLCSGSRLPGMTQGVVTAGRRVPQTELSADQLWPQEEVLGASFRAVESAGFVP